MKLVLRLIGHEVAVAAAGADSVAAAVVAATADVPVAAVVAAGAGASTKRRKFKISQGT